MTRVRVWQRIICIWSLWAAVAAAQDPAPTQTPAGQAAVTEQQITQLQEAVAAQTELTDAQKSQLAEIIQLATADLKAAAAADEQARNAERRAANIETDKANLEKEVSQPTAAPTIEEGRTIPDLEQERVEIEARIAQLEQDLKQPTIDPSARTVSRKALRDLLAELPAKLSEIDAKLQEAVPENDPPIVTEARLLGLNAQKQSIEARLAAARKELAAYDAADAVNLPALRREARTRELNAAQKRLEAIRAEINRLRQAEAERRAREAEHAAINAQPLLKPIFDQNQEMARDEQELRVQHEEDKQLRDQVKSRLKEIEEDAKEARTLDADVGLEKRGVWLRKQRSGLTDLPELYEKVDARADRANDILFSLYERQDQLDNLTADLEALADQLTEQASAAGSVDAEEFHANAVQVLRSQAINLQKLVDEYYDYTETLADLSKQAETLREEAKSYQDFLDERILWVRSHLPLSLSMLTAREDYAVALLSPSTWIGAGQSIGWDAADHLALYGSVAMLLLYLLIRRSQHSRMLQDIAEDANRRVGVSIKPTIQCILLTVLLSAVWPGLILFLAWRLHVSTISSTELQTAAVNLARLAGLFFLLEFVRQSIRPQGLAEAHFGWNSKTLKRVRHVLWTMMGLGLPLAAATACLHQQDFESRRDDFERVLFIAALLVLTFFAHKLLHPKRGALRQMKALQDGGWFDRLDYVWYLLGLGVPLALVMLTYTGYYDTAVRLALKVQQTAWLVVGAIYLHAFLDRWLMLRHRRLRIQLARERLAKAQETSGASESAASLPEVEADDANIDASTEQSQRILTTMIVVGCLVGLWFVWIDVLPAIRFLDRWPIWETTKQSVEQVTDPTTGETENRPVYEIHSVTIASLIQVLVIMLLTATAARNIPGLLEMSVLARLPIDRSTAYAITSLTRYALVLIGLILISKTLGLTWNSVQWLAAALTFGLGFGLQEIFANFVSGLIILFEQPVRVGDVVTIEGVSGVVNRIRIRATTIVDWDRKEYIVPNREFITGRLLNWTLSDKMNRIVINVGVAYGSEPSRVRSVIMKVLEGHPNVLTDPPPLVTFESFGDSALNFVVRAYLPNLDNRLPTIHELHSEIHDRLAEAGISIPFPQRDLHLKTSVVLDGADATNHSNGQSAPTKSESVPGSASS